MKCDYNSKYEFISDGTWFKKGSKCLVCDGTALWIINKGVHNDKTEMSHDFLQENKNNIMGLFVGPIDGNDKDEEMCCLDEFEIVKK